MRKKPGRGGLAKSTSEDHSSVIITCKMAFLYPKRNLLVNLLINIFIFCQPWLIDTRSLPDIDTPEGLHSYMKSYGFVDDDTEVTADTNKESVLKYQRFFGLHETGIIDEETRSLMQKPRCGSRDINAVGYSLASKQYLAKHIRWKLNQTHELVPLLDAKRIISESIQDWLKWMDVLTIAESQDLNSEIIFNFVRPDNYGRHGDGVPFTEYDIGHAFYPDNYDISSDVHINMMKRFSPFEPPSEDEHSLKWVIMHELGHSLGLRHSIHKSSVMYPVIPAGAPYPGLDQDDIYGIKELYGACRTLECKNGGTCIALARTPESICLCPPTHTGVYCDIECNNRHRSNALCDLWAGRGECLVNQEWMQLNCFKSCTKCHFPKCVNLHPDDKECKKWATSGECRTRTKWMNIYCYKACNKCDFLSCPSQLIIP